jgi:hypothetical protein
MWRNEQQQGDDRKHQTAIIIMYPRTNYERLTDAMVVSEKGSMARASQGDATIDPAMSIQKYGNMDHIVVGILGTNKVIAICGESGAPDEDESIANATLLAYLWNAHRARRSHRPDHSGPARRTTPAPPSPRPLRIRQT